MNRRWLPLAAVAAALSPLPAAAHVAAEAQRPPPALSWSYEPAIVLPLCAIGAIWVVGLLRLSGRARRPAAVATWPNLAFAAGWVVLALVLVSPLHAAGSLSFLAHMSEHELLILLAAPLFALSRPAAVLLWGLPRRWRSAFARLGGAGAVRGTWRAATDPAVATPVHGTLLWLWHLPRLFDAALRNEGVHLLQHASFFGSAVLFWWGLLQVGLRRRDHGVAIAALFVTAVHSALLGALLTVAPRVLYAGYAGPAFALSPLEDQQLAGLVMWVPAGLVYTGAGLWLLALWLRGCSTEGGARAAPAA